MKFVSWRGGLLTLVVGVAVLVAGCGPADTAKPGPATQKRGDKGEGAHNYKGRDWCVEHEMPESICVLCNDKLAKGYKDRGDWCADHDVPKSQCFECDPKLKQKFAQEYREKYGEDPPPMEEESKKD